MVLINDKKFACATCIKGHRVSGCTHTDRPLFEVKKKGRPATQCHFCREKRKGNTGTVHTKVRFISLPILHADINKVRMWRRETAFCCRSEVRRCLANPSQLSGSFSVSHASTTVGCSRGFGKQDFGDPERCARFEPYFPEWLQGCA